MSVIALDIGTSRVKAQLAGWDGDILDTRSAPTPVDTGADGRHAFPADAVRAVTESLITVLTDAHPRDPVDTIVIACLGTAMVPVDRSGRPLGAALSPADARPTRGPGLLEQIDLPAAELFERTGSGPRLASSLLHWLWWRRAHPEVATRLHRFRSLRGFVVEGLCGADAEDPSWASRTMIMDLATDAWSDVILGAAGLDAEVLPAIHPSTTCWPVRPAAASRLGLPADARLVLGAMDNCCAFLGASAPDESRLVNICGTYEHMAGVGDGRAVRASAIAADGLIHRYLLPGRYLSYSRVPVGLLLGVVAEAFPGAIDELMEGVATRPMGRTLAREAASVRAALRSGEAGPAVVQALLESCAEVLVRFTAGWVDAGGPLDRIVAVGGGAAHHAVLQLKANLLGRPISTLASDEGTVLGALRLAAVARQGLSPTDACRLFPNPVARTWLPATASRTRLPA